MQNFFSLGGGGGNLYASNKAVQNRHNNVSYAIFFYCKYTVLNWGGGGGGGDSQVFSSPVYI